MKRKYFVMTFGMPCVLGCRISRVVSMVVSSLLVMSCSYTVTTTRSPDFHINEEFKALVDNIDANANSMELELLKKHQNIADEKKFSTIVELFESASKISGVHFQQLTNAYESAWYNFVAPPWFIQRQVMLRHTSKLNPKLFVLNSTDVFVTSLPSGNVLMSSAFAQGFDMGSEKDKNIMFGVLLHELVHIFDGHAMMQWVAADGRVARVKDMQQDVLAKLVSVIPGININRQIGYSVQFRAGAQLGALSEFAADMGAVSIMLDQGRVAADYIDFIKQSASDGSRKQTKSDQSTHMLTLRAMCLEKFGSNSQKSALKMIWIGSLGRNSEAVGLPEIIDLEQVDSVRDILDDPSAVRKYLTDKGIAVSSDEENRNLLLTFIKKYSFIECAIRRVFPKSSPAPEAYVGTYKESERWFVPDFDVVMFTQFLRSYKK